MAKHGVIRTDNMMGTDVGTYLESVRYMGTGSTATEIDNGNVVKIDGLLVIDSAAGTREREIYKAVKPAANTDLKDIVVIANPEVFYDERVRNLDEYVNEAGKTVRGYHLHTHDEFSVTADALSAAAAIAVGNIVELQADVKLKVVATATSGSTTVGKIVAIEKVGRHTYYVIRVA